jgi:hypothetical protein
MKLVFNAEDNYTALGRYAGSEEDSVFYMKPGGYRMAAPADCVEVREVSTEDVAAEIDRLARQVEQAKSWIGGDSLTAMNSLVQAGVELAEYARIMGALLSPEAAKAELDRKVESGDYYIGARAHSGLFALETL